MRYAAGMSALLALLLACSHREAPAPAAAPTSPEAPATPAVSTEPTAAPAAAPAPEPPPPPVVDGVLRFRGSYLRDYYGQGTLPRKPTRVDWRISVGAIDKWNGVGWTGQPLLAVWSEEAKAAQKWLNNKPPHVEVISAGLDGKVRFINGETGELTRPTLQAQDAPIKGTPALDPRFPVLYVGQGLKGNDGGWHLRAISLLDFTRLMDIPGGKRVWDGQEMTPFRSWGASDGNALVLPEKDLLLHSGENGVFYQVKLNGVSGWPSKPPSPEGFGPLITPQIKPTAFSAGVPPKGKAEGVESSISTYNNIAYWGDNVGTLVAYDLEKQAEIWRLDLGDDTDSTAAIAIEGGKPYIYVGSEVDKQVSERPARKQGMGRFSKVDATTGQFVWRYEIPAWTIRGETALTDLNGGFVATVCMGKAETADRVFIVSAHEPTIGAGRIYALARDAGPDGKPKVLWSAKLPGLAWSSPITDGKTVVAPDSTGYVSGFDAQTGELLWRLWLGGGAVESSPVFWDNAIYVGVRGGSIVRISEAPAGKAGPSAAPPPPKPAPAAPAAPATPQ